MGIVCISIPAHDQLKRFKALASLGTVGHVFRRVASSSWDDNISFLYKEDAHRAQRPILLGAALRH